MTEINGATALIQTLAAGGVHVCFANPGTSEMHLVQAVDATPDMRAVLCLFEGVCSGAADGYGRMLERPACTLLHLGAGLANAVANLHNARRAATPIINIVGDHAIHHVPFDAPLTSDVEAVAKPVSAWIRTPRASTTLAEDGLHALNAVMGPSPDPAGSIATLIVPADCAWGAGVSLAVPQASKQRSQVTDETVQSVSKLLDGDTLLLVDGNGLQEAGLHALARLVVKTGVRVSSTTFPARVESGPGLFPVPRMPYFPEQVQATLHGVKRIVLAGAERPVSFFAYRNTPSDLVPEGCEVVRLAHRHQDVAQALMRVADVLDAEVPNLEVTAERPAPPEGVLTTAGVSAALAAALPDGAIVCTDSGGGGAAYPILQKAVRHTWLNLTGGSIGQGGPVATGAAIACPGRPVFALLGDGGAGYTIQYLWTAARERLNVTTVIYSNRSYNILDVEYQRIGVNDAGEKAASMFSLADPDIDWVKLAEGYGVPGERVATGEAMMAALSRAAAVDGPYLIEATLG